MSEQYFEPTSPARPSRSEILQAVIKVTALLCARGRAPLHDREKDAAEREYKKARATLIRHGNIRNDARAFLENYSNLDEYFFAGARQFRSYAERDAFVHSAFRTTRKMLENEIEFPVELNHDSLDALSGNEARRCLQKAQSRIDDGDYDGAITCARALLETVAHKILDHFEVKYSEEDTPSAIYKKALELVFLKDEAHKEYFLKFSRAIANIVEQIALYRNKVGDSHGSATGKIIFEYQARYVIHLAGCTAIFLAECFEDRTI